MIADRSLGTSAIAANSVGRINVRATVVAVQKLFSSSVVLSTEGITDLESGNLDRWKDRGGPLGPRGRHVVVRNTGVDLAATLTKLLAIRLN